MWREVLRVLRAGRGRRVLGFMRRIFAHYVTFCNPGIAEYPFLCGERFLIHGIAHNTRSVERLLIEALYLGRTAILPPMHIPAAHNLGRSLKVLISEYYDLSKSYAVLPDTLRVPLSYIEYRDFWRGANAIFPLRSALIFRNRKKISRQETQRYRIVVRHCNPWVRMPYEVPQTASFFKFQEETQIHLQVADVLRQQAEEVRAALGNYYFFQWRAPWDSHVPPPRSGSGARPWEGGCYQSEHRNVVRHFMDAEGLGRQLAKIFPRGSKLYIAANIWRPYDEEYFGRLQELYRVYRCYDFPQLARLAEGPERNTAKLNLIENIIGEHAAHRLKVHPGWKGWLAEMQRIVDLPDPN